MPTPQPITIFVLYARDPGIAPRLWQIRGHNYKTKEDVEFPPDTINDSCAAYRLLHEATRMLGWVWYLDEMLAE